MLKLAQNRMMECRLVHETGKSIPKVSEHLFGYGDSVLNKLRCLINNPELLDLDDWIELRESLPYLLKQSPMGKKYMVLNRNYQPIWLYGARNFKSGHLYITLSKKIIQEVVISPRDLRLFNDGNAPWNSRSDLDKYHGKLIKFRELILESSLETELYLS